MFEDIKVGDQVMVGLCSLAKVVSVSPKQFKTIADDREDIWAHKKENGCGIGDSPFAYPLTPENLAKIEDGKIFDAAYFYSYNLLKNSEKMKTLFSDGWKRSGLKKSKWIHNKSEEKQKLHDLLEQLDQLAIQAEHIAKGILR